MKRKSPKKVSPQKAKARLGKHLEQINLYAAGIDVGSVAHYVAVPDGLDDQPVRSFSCFTADLNQMADWLVEIGIQTVVMESTGVYWIPVFEILEERGLMLAAPWKCSKTSGMKMLLNLHKEKYELVHIGL